MAVLHKTAVIIGDGPAGLTAALELCRRSSIRPIVLEASDRIGGISCTIRHNGNRIDIGGHRFFSKSDRVMDWWTELMPVVGGEPDEELVIKYQNQQRAVRRDSDYVRDPIRQSSLDYDPDCVMLVRPRRSRIYCMRSFFDYPLSLTASTLRGLGLSRTFPIGTSYIKARAFQRKPEKTLEEFLINRFGRELYLTFFKSYTEKVWGVSCDRISAAWGAQRIKGLSLRTAVVHFFKKLVSGTRKTADIKQKESETSLIEKFLYPKFGPGQLWEYVAKLIESQGGEIRMGWRVTCLHIDTDATGADRVTLVEARTPAGEVITIPGDYFFSTMPVRELLRAMDSSIPAEVRAISDGLMYRDFITVGLLVDVVGYWYEEQKECLYKVLNHLPEAEIAIPAGAPIVVPDPLLALTLQHYAPDQIASRIVFPVDFPAIRRYRHDDSPEQNLWAGRNTLYALPILPLATFQHDAGDYLIITSDSNWLLEDLARHRYAVERLDINNRAGALGGFTPLSHGNAVFYVSSGDEVFDGISSPDSVPIPFRVSDNLPEPKALPGGADLRAERER